MKIEVVQFAPTFPGREENWARIRAWAERSPADVVLFPELSSCGYMYEDPKEMAGYTDSAEVLAPLEMLSAQTEKLFVGGFAHRTNGHVYNAAYAVGPEGTSVYRKIHLWNREKLLFDEGDRPALVEYRGRRIGLEICYDLQFPELASYLARKGAELILAPTSWAQDRHGPSRGLHPHAFLAMAAAYANGVCVAVSNRTGLERGAFFPGQSCLAGPWGMVATLGSGEESQVLDLPFDQMAEAKHPSPHNHLDTDPRMSIRPPGATTSRNGSRARPAKRPRNAR